MARRTGLQGIDGLSAYDPDSGEVRVIVETPRGSRSKIKFDNELALFKVSHVLPEGSVFPFDFGFVPATLADDGDPLDVLVLMDGSTFAGCLLVARLVGVIEAVQTEDGEESRNDRLLAVAVESREHRDVATMDDIGAQLLEEIEHFFVSYNEFRGKQFRPIGRHGAERAGALLERAIELAKTPRRGAKSRRSRGSTKKKA